MDHRTSVWRRVRRIAGWMAGCGWTALAGLHGAEDGGAYVKSLERMFAQPAGDARARLQYAIPRGGWQLDALVADLERMKNAGIGGVTYLDGYEGHGQVFGDVSHFHAEESKSPPYMSPGHLKQLNTFFEAAAARDLKVFSPIRAMYMTGGPWIDQDHAVKEYTLSKTYVTGPTKVRVQLPKPAHRDADAVEAAHRKKFYRDVAVMAWPVKGDPRGTAMHRHRPKITVNHAESHAEREFLADGDALSAMWIRGVWLLPFGPKPAVMPKGTTIDFEFAQPFDARTFFITLAPDKIKVPIRGALWSSRDGKNYEKVQDFDVLIGDEKSVPLTPGPARWFRVTFPPLTNRDSIGVAEIEFLAEGEKPVAHERIQDFDLKAARVCWEQGLGLTSPDYYGSSFFYKPPMPTPAASVIRQADVRNLTGRMAADGTLEWDVPEGRWCVMRFGYTLAKHGYVTARPGGSGYECDIYSAESANIQYDNVPARIVRALSPQAKQGLQGFWFESFELGPANWTTKMAEEFKALAGYDLLPWLPALGDEVVEGVEQSDAFLSDFRNTLHTLFADRHHGTIQRRARQDGLQWTSQTGGSKQSHQNELLYLSRTHIPGGEFWSGVATIGHTNILTEVSGARGTKGEKTWWNSETQAKLPASVSHTYGNSPFVIMEALTGTDNDLHRTPVFDKHTIDRAFCTGANLLCMGIWPSDSRPSVFPGAHHWGWITPRNTLFGQLPAFALYVSRCQSLLQQGRFQADVAIAQEGALHLRERNGSQVWPKVYVPKGYDYDFVSRELLLADLHVKDGRLTLSSGMSYAVLHVPDFANRLSLAGLKKIEALLQSGAAISAPRPVAGLSALDYADGLKQHRELVERIWGGLDGRTKTRKTLGPGRLYWGLPIDEVLEREGVAPDFSYEGNESYVDHIHRRIDAPNVDFYFLANAINQPAAIKARFRGQADRTAHLFDPLTGEVWRLPAGTPVGKDLELSLKLEPVGSAFVVFSSNRTSAPAAASARTAALAAPVTLDGPWNVDFKNMFGDRFSREFKTLASFAASDDRQVKYFSGEATYRNRFNLPSGVGDARVLLECGEVRWAADIHVNDQKVGAVWCPPWRLDITRFCRPGENRVRIVCYNPWKNHLIGEAQRPDSERRTVINNFRVSPADFKGMELMEAGLLGPVRVRFAAPVEGRRP